MLSTLDISFLIVIALLIFLGAWQGFFSQLMSWVALAAAFFLAPALSNYILSDRMMGDDGDFLMVRLIWVASGVFIYLGLRLVSRGIQMFLLDRFKIVKWTNRLGGALFGAAKASVLVLVFALGLSWMPDGILVTSKIQESSKILQKAKSINDTLVPYLLSRQFDWDDKKEMGPTDEKSGSFISSRVKSPHSIKEERAPQSEREALENLLKRSDEKEFSY